MTQHKILFVDDERSLLNGIERRLGDDFDIWTAESGAEGLETIQEQGPFAVIFTDMQMPRMNGVEFASQGQALAPDSTFVMLTGNQDQQTAVEAINRGNVFRFLNKPCDSEDLRKAIHDGIRQYELVTHEKELLNKTFVRSVSILTDVIEITQPDLIGRADQIGSKMEELCRALEIDNRWEYKLAARLSLVGLALLAKDKRDLVMNESHRSQNARLALEESMMITSRLISDTPRLGGIASLLSEQRKSEGNLTEGEPASENEVVQTGATLLRVATHWEFLAQQGLDASSIQDELTALMPELPGTLLDSVVNGQASEDSNVTYLDCHPTDLEPGMVVSRDIRSADGIVLVRSGRRLSQAMIQNLASYGMLKSVTVIVPTSLEAVG